MDDEIKALLYCCRPRILRFQCCLWAARLGRVDKKSNPDAEDTIYRALFNIEILGLGFYLVGVCRVWFVVCSICWSTVHWMNGRVGQSMMWHSLPGNFFGFWSTAVWLCPNVGHPSWGNHWEHILRTPKTHIQETAFLLFHQKERLFIAEVISHSMPFNAIQYLSW